MLCYFLHFCLSSCGPSVKEANQGVNKGSFTCRSLGFILLFQQRQSIAPGNTELLWACWKHSCLQMIASFFPKGRETNSSGNKCHKDKTQDVFLFSPVILVNACSLENQDNSLTLRGGGEFCNFCLSVGDSWCLPGILVPQLRQTYS